MSRGALVMLRACERRVRVGGSWQRMAVFKCACGREVMRAARTKTKDCGCGSYAKPRHEEHGGSRLGLYAVWRSMLARCADEENERYGGRGIEVCARWQQSFAAFLSDVGTRPFDGASLDRIDNAKGYEPGNVRWASATMQNRNKSNNRVVTAFGESLCLAAWSERWGVAAGTIAKRIDDLGWPNESAVSTLGEVK